MNPLKRIRVEAYMSQKEAASIAGVTEQVVLKVEQGLYPTMPPSMLRAYSTISGDTPAELEYRYEKWIDDELRLVRLPVGSIHIATPGEFIIWRNQVCKLNEVPDTVNSFCKLFKLNPYIIQKFEAGRLKQTPMQLQERIAYIKGEF
jgi:DNA-binding XRE family transcriptional regulator